MTRKLDINELDIPKDDIECWEKYPKHHWVYDLSRLLDSQNVRWCPFEHDLFPDKEPNMSLVSVDNINRAPGYIYVKKPNDVNLMTEIYIVRGEIKLMKHIDLSTGKDIDIIMGQLELSLNAFVTLYFQKFTGVISAETHSTDIFRVSLRPHRDIKSTTDMEVIKLLKRIYKKTDITLSGLSDQALHELLAS